jgi:glycosyltransferase involved in cell wall biosynthesis
MKVLISAYLCAPKTGSEEEVAMSVLLAAASQHDVWMLTHRDTAAEVEEEVAAHGLSHRVTIIGLDVDPPVPNARKRSLPFRHWAYDSWQRQMQKVATELDREVGFDVVHHATIASFWTRCGLDVLDKPLVLGPVGGGVGCPTSLLTSLGVRGMFGYFLRATTRHLFTSRPAVRRSWEQASLILAQNEETAAKIPASCNVEVYPNGLSSSVLVPAADGSRTKDIIYAGRLLPWKGLNLAIKALSMVSDPEVRLCIYGEGPDRSRLEAVAARYGLQSRVVFGGLIDRDELHRKLAMAGALIHPAVHEEGGLSMTEAMILGTPVIALNRGGVVASSQRIPGAVITLVEAAGAVRTARRMAAAIDGYIATPPGVLARPALPEVTFADKILSSYEQVVRNEKAKRERANRGVA